MNILPKIWINWIKHLREYVENYSLLVEQAQVDSKNKLLDTYSQT